MKKILLIIMGITAAFPAAKAQYSPLEFFPNTEGSVLVNTIFNGDDTPIARLTYTILESYDYQNDQTTNIRYDLVDMEGNSLYSGIISAEYRDGGFYMNPIHLSSASELMKYLSLETQLMGDFLDYPDFFGLDSPFEDGGIFQMPEGSMVIRSASSREEVAAMRIFGREYEKQERIQTPAGEFHASRIKFRVGVKDTDKDLETILVGYEWYAAQAGIVRSEIRDERGRLVNYTVLTRLDLAN